MMEITCGSAWQTSSGYRREYRVSLDEKDLIEQMGDDAEAIAKVAAMKPSEKRRQLSTRADIMVVIYMMEEGEMTKEFGMNRLAELKAKLL